MSFKIAIIYTTFLRDELMERTIKSIFNNWHDDFVLLIGDQGHPQKQFSRDEIDIMSSKGRCEYIMLPFDCGLSQARNILVEKAVIMGLQYSLITADSIEFISMTITKLDMAIKFLNSMPDAGILGFDLKNRIPWEFFMDLDKDEFIFKKAIQMRRDITTNLSIKNCDICRNFFIAKTRILQEVKWDNDLKLCEHEDFFWRYKKTGYKVYWTPDIIGNYIDYKPIEYFQYRQRMYSEKAFRGRLKRKYNLTGWVKYH